MTLPPQPTPPYEAPTLTTPTTTTPSTKNAEHTLVYVTVYRTLALHSVVVPGPVVGFDAVVELAGTVPLPHALLLDVPTHWSQRTATDIREF